MLQRPARGHCTTNHPFVGRIEERTKRFVTIESKKNDTNLARCHSQQQSGLFSLPAEIRDNIWNLASTPNVNPDHLKSGPECLTYLRMPIVWRVDLSWLRACRRIWLEANEFSWQNAEPAFYRHSMKPDLYGFFYDLTSLNVERLRRLHIGQEVHILKLNDAIIKLLEQTQLQAWPPSLTITLIAYPSLWDPDTISAWIGQILGHRKLSTVKDVQILLHVVESQAELIMSSVKEAQTALTSSDWKVQLGDEQGKRWLREWGDTTMKSPNWANKVDIWYRSFKLDCSRNPGTCQKRPQDYRRELTWDCWHLIPYRTMFGRRDSMEPDFVFADQCTERLRKQWKEQNSLLKFAD